MHSKQHSQDSSHRKQQHRVAILSETHVSHSLYFSAREGKLTKLSSIHGSSSAAEEPAGTASAAGGCQLRTDYSRFEINIPEEGTGGSPAEEDSRPEGSLEGDSWFGVSDRSSKWSCAQRDNATTRRAFVAHKAQNRGEELTPEEGEDRRSTG